MGYLLLKPDKALALMYHHEVLDEPDYARSHCSSTSTAWSWSTYLDGPCPCSDWYTWWIPCEHMFTVLKLMAVDVGAPHEHPPYDFMHQPRMTEGMEIT